MSLVKSYQMCTRCVMDTSAKDIDFDEEGVCNFCTEFITRSEHILHKDEIQRNQDLDTFVAKVKADGKGKQYDCIVGVSGGVDSSWVLLQVIELGLRPLAVHMDNGWNSELAQNNIANLVHGLNVDLYTHVIEWDEYKSLMQAFFDADVIDVELLYDNATLGVNYRLAAQHGVKYILSGSNLATEGMKMPEGWNWFKFDKRNIKAIGSKFGNVGLSTFPAIGTLGYIWNEVVRKRHWYPFLDYLDFNKQQAIEVLQRDFDYKPYPYKHYESIFTRFYQGYILPQKFGVDKRKVHLSTLIAAGQISRIEALKGLEGIAYSSEQELEDDKQYFMKKMGWKKEQLIDYIQRPEINHTAYLSEKKFWDLSFSAYKMLFGRDK